MSRCDQTIAFDLGKDSFGLSTKIGDAVEELHSLVDSAWDKALRMVYPEKVTLSE